jgi:ABC-type dipeptide/oligopeptide/nickel transport system permease component
MTMDFIIFAGLSIPAFTLVLLMVSLFQSFKKINYGFKRTNKFVLSKSNTKNEINDKPAKTSLDHWDFSGGLLGI